VYVGSCLLTLPLPRYTAQHSATAKTSTTIYYKSEVLQITFSFKAPLPQLICPFK